MSTFTGKVAVVTGAGSGIGRALALELAGRGAKLALSDVDTAGLDETVRRVEALGAEVKSDFLDVSQRETVLDYAEAVVAHFGKVNQIYNNAGIAYHGDVEKSSFKDIERIVDVDFWGVVNGTKHFCRTSRPPATATSSTSPASSACWPCRRSPRTTPRSSPSEGSANRCAWRC